MIHMTSSFAAAEECTSADLLRLRLQYLVVCRDMGLDAPVGSN